MAWISHKHETIFLHNPKTGGCSIGRALEERGFVRSWYDKRWRSEQYQHLYEIPKEFEDYLVFTVWRNPYDRVVSWWKFLSQREKKLDSSVTFRMFLEDDSWMRPESYDIRWDTRMQYPFINRADILFRFDTLTRGLDIPGLGHIKLPRLNTSNHGHWTKYYDSWCYGFVRGFYHRDFVEIKRLCDPKAAA